MLRKFTPEDYFRFERRNAEKSEYYKGEILTMPGASYFHNVLTAQMIISLGNCLSSKGCIICSNDMKFYMPVCKLNAYPDFMAICEEPQYLEGEENYVLLNPNLVGEVLSPSTEDYDRNVKLPCYLTTPSVKLVVLVAQSQKQVEIYYKDNPSKPEIYTQGTFKIFDCEMEIEQIYRNIKFEPQNQ